MIQDQIHESVYYYNKDECLKQKTPASTFKILNSLIALETGVAPDESLVISWDSVDRGYPAWNKAMNMREAFKVSNVGYYKEIARRIGYDRMAHYIDTIQYGNQELKTPIDEFWLDNSLKISADEQLGFVKRLYFAELKGFSERSQRIVKSMMLQEDGKDQKLYYKTGWGKLEDKEVLWVVGFSEIIKKVQEPEGSMNKSGVRITPYFFALNFEIPRKDTSRDWISERLSLAKDLLKEYGAW